MSSAAQSTQDAAPDTFHLRARPPSPKRLSAKVLLAGALAMGMAVATALMLGLAERPDQSAAERESTAAQSGPPDTIALAPTEYDAAHMGGTGLEEEVGGAEYEMPQLPRDWSGTGALQSTPSAQPAAHADSEPQARASALLFAAAGSAGAGAASGERLDAALTPPRSPYELMAGSVIAAALVTELNSDVPGRVIAQVTAPVFDSVSGRHLLIPQGARLIGVYDSNTTYGDRRLTLVWQRLILPNGWSLALDDMIGTDPAGGAGLRDLTDNHLDRLGVAIGLSAIVSIIANEAENENDDESLSASVGDAAAQEAARTGGRIIDRELEVRPTLRVRAGAPVRVLVTRDMRLRPYRG